MTKKILVIEDNDDILEALSIILKSASYEVHLSKGRESILGLIENTEPKLIILDALLGGVDGREIAKKIKEDTRLSGIPIIMISAHPELEQMAFECGIEDFISKPFDISTLLGKVRAYI
ncbi:MAG: response regulator [bacterium]|nr:response regulator [bacterium]